MGRHRKSGLWLGLASLWLAFASAPVAFAQSRATTADLSGAVFDQSQGALPGVTVTATNASTGLVRSTVSESDGRFAIPALPPGNYDVNVELSGFAPQSRTGLPLALGQSLDLEFTLRIAGTTETVTVVGESALVDVQQTAVAAVVSQQQIETLPINGRNFISFSIITPGVSTDRTPQQGASATSGLTFAGQRARSNNITVDGLDNNDSTIGAVRATFSQEAVQEFQVITNSYSAEFGKASGGVVNIVTRSGGNTSSGNAFFYFRDEALNAKAHFERFNPDETTINRPKAPFAQRQFGGTFGGPLKRNRSFFFFSVEHLNVQASNFVNIDSVTPVLVFGQNVGTTVDILRRAGFPVETGNVPYDVESTQVLLKVDHSINQAHSLALRVNWADLLNENVEPWGGQVAKSRGASIDSKDFMLASSLTSVLSSRTVNELRFQVANRDQQVLSLDPACQGACDAQNEGGPTLEVGAIGVGRHRFTPQPRHNRRFQFLDAFSYSFGDHQVKFGADFSYIDHIEQSLPLHFGGRYIFQALPAIPGVLPAPINAVQALALGLPAAYVQGYGTPDVPYGYRDLSTFVQDDWRLGRNLSVKVGLRYQNQFWEDSTRTVPGLAPYEYPKDNNNVAPRLAVAWDPTGDKKTSVQASYGIFYDNHITGIFGITQGLSGTRDHVRTLLLRFPQSLAAWGAPGRRLPEPTAAYPSTVISVDPALKTPYARHTSVGVERELTSDLAMAAHFIHARGIDQIGTIDYNPVTNPAIGGRPLDVGGVPLTSSSVLQYTTWGETWYRGLALSLRKRLSNRYQFLASYTLSKAEDTSADYQSFFIPQNNGLGRNPNDPNGLPIGFVPRAEKGPSLQDQRHRLVLSGAYILPFDVTLSSIVTLASGRPYNILAGADLNRDGDGGASPADRPRATLADVTTSIGRNAGVLPNEYTVDLRVAKRVGLGSRLKADLMLEAFNVFNHTNYTNIDNVFGTGAYPTNPLPTFGQLTEAAPPFQAQLAVKVSF